MLPTGLVAPSTSYAIIGDSSRRMLHLVQLSLKDVEKRPNKQVQIRRRLLHGSFASSLTCTCRTSSSVGACTVLMAAFVRMLRRGMYQPERNNGEIEEDDLMWERLRDAVLAFPHLNDDARTSSESCVHLGLPTQSCDPGGGQCNAMSHARRIAQTS